MPIRAEHILQVRLKEWVNEAVMPPHKFLAFDRAAPYGQWSHDRERARGVTKGTPDTLLILKGAMIWAEMKDPRKHLDDEKFIRDFPDQWRMGQELKALGHSWGWFQDIVSYMRWLVAMRIQLSPLADFLANRKDAVVQSLIEKAEMSAGKLPKRLKEYRPEPRPSVARIRRSERARILPP